MTRALVRNLDALTDRVDVEAERGQMRDKRLDRLERQIDTLTTQRTMERPGKLDDFILDGKKLGEMGEGVAKWKGAMWTAFGMVLVAFGIVVVYLVATGQWLDALREAYEITHPPVQVEVSVPEAPRPLPSRAETIRRRDSLNALLGDSIQ